MEWINKQGCLLLKLEQQPQTKLLHGAESVDAKRLFTVVKPKCRLTGCSGWRLFHVIKMLLRQLTQLEKKAATANFKSKVDSKLLQ